jgi:hypothetical protein
MALQHLRSSTADKRPTPAAMADGQLALNTNLASPGLFFKDSNGDLVKVGPVHVGTTAPNATPASGGQSGNSKGEQWLDTSSSRYVFKIWDGSAWRSEDGEFVNASGDTMTGALGIIAGSAASPSVFISGDTNTGIYSPGADQLAISTNGTERVIIGSSGEITIGKENVTNAVINAPESVFVNIDSNNDDTGEAFVVGTNRSSTTGGTELFRIQEDGKVGLGTSSPTHDLTIGHSLPQDYVLAFRGGVGGFLGWDDSANCTILQAPNTRSLQFRVNSDTFSAGTMAMHINSSGNVGIGTTSATQLLTLEHTTDNDGIRLYNRVFTAGSRSRIGFNALNSYSSTSVNAAIDAILVSNSNTATELAFSTAGNNNLNSGGLIERARIDSSGRLLVGTSSSTNVNTRAVFQGYGASANEYAIVCLKRGDDPSVAGSGLGLLSFGDKDADNVASIGAYRDTGTWTHDVSEPTRLVFSTTADGASSPTERMRIKQSGQVVINGASSSQFVIEPSSGTYNSSEILLYGRNATNVLQPYSTIRSGHAGAGGTTSFLSFNTNDAAGSQNEAFKLDYNGAATFPLVSTTASAANAFLDSANSNNLLRSTSSLRYKTNVEDLEEERSNAILNLRPVWYRSKAAADRKDWSWYGLIAEEVAQVEPRLVHWTYLDDAYEEVDGQKQLKTGAELAPDGVQYDRLTVLLLDVVKRQQQQIEALEAKVAALETYE